MFFLSSAKPSSYFATAATLFIILFAVSTSQAQSLGGVNSTGTEGNE